MSVRTVLSFSLRSEQDARYRLAEADGLRVVLAERVLRELFDDWPESEITSPEFVGRILVIRVLMPLDHREIFDEMLPDVLYALMQDATDESAIHLCREICRRAGDNPGLGDAARFLRRLQALRDDERTDPNIEILDVGAITELEDEASMAETLPPPPCVSDRR